MIDNNFIMSVYSGFATRHQQHKYNSLIQTLVISLKKRIIKFYAGQQADEDKFKLLIKKIYKKMLILEKGKYMAPKYSSCFSDLIDALHIEINYDTLSECSSMMSQTFSLRKDQTDPDNQPLRSNALLSSKKQLLQAKASKIFNSSTFSLSRKVDTLKPDNWQEQQEKRQLKDLAPRSTSLDPGAGKSRFRSKGKLQQLKNFRGTLNMPRVQDFLLQKQPNQTLGPPRRNTFIDNKMPAGVHQSPKTNNKVVFRRQKYSRAEIKAQDI